MSDFGRLSEPEISRLRACVRDAEKTVQGALAAMHEFAVVCSASSETQDVEIAARSDSVVATDRLDGKTRASVVCAERRSLSKSGGSQPYLIATLLSLAAHAWLFTLALGEQSARLGAVGRELDTISVEIVTVGVVESIESRISADVAAGSVAPIESRLGAQAIMDQIEVAAAQPNAQADPVPPVPQELGLREASIAPDAELQRSPEAQERGERREEEAPEPESAKPQTHVQEESGPDRVMQVAQEAQVSGGAAARAAEDTAHQEASVAASQGELLHYALKVRAALGSTRPRHEGLRGRVVVVFSLRETGLVRYATIEKSSGKRVLDRAALAAVLRTGFPVPPKGMTDSQLTYTVPFDFR